MTQPTTKRLVTEATYGTQPALKREAAGRRRDRLPSRLVTRQLAPAANTPVVTWQNNGGQIATAPFNKVVDVIAAGKVAIRGLPASKMTHPAGGYPSTVSYRPSGVRGADVVGYTGVPGYGLDFLTDAPQIECWGFNRGGTTYRVSTDDGVVGSLTPTQRPTTGALESIMVDFSALSTPSKLRRVLLELSGWDLYGIGLPIPAGYTNTPYTIAPAPTRGPLWLVLGDSLVGGSPVDSGFQIRIPSILGERFGWRTHNLGVGGIGYITINGSAPAAVAQATAIAAAYAGVDVDGILICYGHNDPSASAAAITAAAAQVYAILAAAFPSALIVFTGPLGAVSAANTASLTAIETAIRAAIPATVPFLSQVTNPYIFGSGTKAALTKDGNADLYIGKSDGTDLVHWDDKGTELATERLGRDLQSAISSTDLNPYV